MAKIITLQGPRTGLNFTCDSNPSTIGRQEDCIICLDAPAVSRIHARITHEGEQFYVEDLKSSNGTYVNGNRIKERTPITEDDTLQVGPFHLALRLQDVVKPSDTDSIIKAQVNALSSHHTIFSNKAEQKMRIFLEISRSLGGTLDMQPLLERMIEQLFHMFPQGDRGMVILCQGEDLEVKVQRSRGAEPLSGSGSGQNQALDQEKPPQSDLPFSRSLVRIALEDGVGLLSENVAADPEMPKTQTMMNLNLFSLMCVPLIGLDKQRLGVIQLDSLRAGVKFTAQDLELLTALAFQVAGVLENAALHEAQMREERLRQELALAQEIQQAFLPQDFSSFRTQGYDVFARVHPARKVSGDLYDLFQRDDGKLAFYLGDVAGKGVPAALFMIMVRALIRHLGRQSSTPTEMLIRLNDALIEDNPTSLFVTLAHGLYTPSTGEIVIVSGGQPTPLIRRRDGSMERVEIPPCIMLGQTDFIKEPEEVRFTLEPGDMLALYSDGLTEPFNKKREMYEIEGLERSLSKAGSESNLEICCEHVRADIAEFTGSEELQDDQTLLLLRRHENGET